MAQFMIEETKYQPRFRAYLMHRGLNVGDTYHNYEYMSWVTGKCSEFMKMKKIQYLSAKDHKEFTNWLFLI